jgi:hypothetical protein
MSLDPYPIMYGRPLDESEWRKVFELLEEVNLPKARTLGAIYRENVQAAWDNYRRVYDEIMTRIEEDNRRINDHRAEYEVLLQEYMDRLTAREAYWDERMKEPRDRYMALSALAESIPGVWTPELSLSVHGPKEFAQILASDSDTDSKEEGESSPAAPPSSVEDPPAVATGAEGSEPAWQNPVLCNSGSSQASADTLATPSPSGTIAQADERPKPIPVLTAAEVADEGQIPTFAEKPIPSAGPDRNVGHGLARHLCVLTGHLPRGD